MGNPLVHGCKSSWPQILFQPLLLWTVSHRLWAAWHKCHLTEPWQCTAGLLTFCLELLWCWMCVPYERDWQSHMHYTYILEGEPTEKWFLFLLLCWVVLKHTRGLLGPPLDQGKQPSLEVASSITYFWMNSSSHSFCSKVLYSGFLKSHFQINHSHSNLCFRVCFRKIHMKILDLLFI